MFITSLAASPPVHVNNTSLDVDGGGVPNPFPEIQAIEASLDNNIDVEKVSPMHSIDGDVENNDKAVNPKRCKLPPFTPWWCISHRESARPYRLQKYCVQCMHSQIVMEVET